VSDDVKRCLRLSDVARVIAYRCPDGLPDDDAGREYLTEWLLPISLGMDASRKMAALIKGEAAWMPVNEATALIERVLSLPIYKRKPKAELLGKALRLTLAELEQIAASTNKPIRTIAPCDVTREQLLEHRKAKARARKERHRRRKGARSRAEYLATAKSRLKPWVPLGISKRTYYRRLAADMAPWHKSETHELLQ
jgi:hypothetical protein